jgi:SAM-dependent methyltransferase
VPSRIAPSRFAVLRIAVVPAILVLGCSPSGPRPLAWLPGKDAIWLATPPPVALRMLRMANVGPDDFVVDLGCGDGRVVIAAARRFGARGLGVDLNEGLVEKARRAAQRAGLTGRVAFRVADLFETDIGRATVLALYLGEKPNLRLRQRILTELRPGARVVSHNFGLGDWPADDFDLVEGRKLYLWVVPARVAGIWRSRLPWDGGAEAYEIRLEQRFQRVWGTWRSGARGGPVGAGLRGDRARFTWVEERGGRRVEVEFVGRVGGGKIEGVLRPGAGHHPATWEASGPITGGPSASRGALPRGGPPGSPDPRAGASPPE